MKRLFNRINKVPQPKKNCPIRARRRVNHGSGDPNIVDGFACRSQRGEALGGGKSGYPINYVVRLFPLETIDEIRLIKWDNFISSLEHFSRFD